MTRRLLTLCVLYGAALVAADKASIEQLDKNWLKAVLGKDLAALDRMYTDDIVYAHASGVVDTKTSYLEKLKSGKQVYKSMEQRKVSVRLYGDSAVTHSWMRVTGVNPQGPFDDKVMMIHVWVQKNGQWRMAAHQTTRVDQMPQ
ncbi:MAG: nuclear transport factor 2 family protein [Bryobacterales bacterium]|nr:nuclear transport factor 2 family protein [Bryobacterales bacterium]